MDTVEDLIKQKPHLLHPLRFYEKSLRFMDAVKELRIPSRPGLNAYPPEFTGRIVEEFLSVFDLPEGSLSPLKQALELCEIDFTRIPLLEVPSFSLPYAEDDLTMLLFLLSRPFFFGLRVAHHPDNRQGNEGRCPVCSARPSLLSLAAGSKRDAHCSFCGAEGRGDSAGCPICLTRDAAKLSDYAFRGEEGFKVHTCDACKAYVKTVDKGLLSRITPDLADLTSLPLDVVIQGKGYKRPSPNPIGMLRMSANG